MRKRLFITLGIVFAIIAGLGYYKYHTIKVAMSTPWSQPPEAVTTTIEQKHLTLSGWQKFGAIIVILGISVGAFGMATYGYVAARDWGCKTGAFQKGCPVDKAAPQRADIPA